MTLTTKSFFLLVVIRKKFNFNTFKMLLNFLSAIYNGEISLKGRLFSKKFREKNRGFKRL